MAMVVSVGARAVLDPSRTDEDSLGIGVGLFAELDDGRRIDVDPGHCRLSGPRRGLGALWGHITVDPRTLATLDRELFERDPLEASTRAIEAEFVLRPVQVEAIVKDEMDDSPALLANLVGALHAARITMTTDTLRAVPFRVELDQDLRAELDR
jgi:hypothetical protein